MASTWPWMYQKPLPASVVWIDTQRAVDGARSWVPTKPLHASTAAPDRSGAAGAACRVRA